MLFSQEVQLTINSAAETRELGRKIGVHLVPGIVVALTGDLGSGKTAFVQGIAAGFDVPEEYYVTSPSYTIINEYPGRFVLFHVDLYRLVDYVDLEDTGIYEILHADGVVVIEWADRLDPDFLSEHLSFRFEILDEESRRVYITAYGLDNINILKKIFE